MIFIDFLSNFVTKLLQIYHLPRLHEIACLEAVEVDTACHIGGIPCDLMVANSLILAHKACYFLTQQIENDQTHVSRLRKSVLYCRRRIERIREII